MPVTLDNPKSAARQALPLGPIPSTKKNRATGDQAFKALVAGSAGTIPLIAVAMLALLGWASIECFRTQGLPFFFKQDWDPVHGSFGMLAFAYGTLASSLIALIIAAPVGVGIALAITEFTHPKVREVAAWLVETLSAVPSVIFGLWGMFVMAPFMRAHVEPILHQIPGPFFRETGTGLSLLTAGLVISIMILPTVMAVCREVFNAIPVSMRESAMALGSTRWESVRLAVLAPSTPGIIGALILAMGRALGETMAVTMVIGNRAEISSNLLAPSDTLASAIANQFTEATTSGHLSALAALGFVLFLITMILNAAAQGLIWLVKRRVGA